MVRPDVVLFGEQLPDRLFRLASEDFPVCDLLLVFGTSLAVRSFQPPGNYGTLTVCKVSDYMTGKQEGNCPIYLRRWSFERSAFGLFSYLSGL